MDFVPGFALGKNVPFYLIHDFVTIRFIINWCAVIRNINGSFGKIFRKF